MILKDPVIASIDQYDLVYRRKTCLCLLGGFRYSTLHSGQVNTLGLQVEHIRCDSCIMNKSYDTAPQIRS